MIGSNAASAPNRAPARSLAQAARAMEGRLETASPAGGAAAESAEWRGIVIDSRKVRGGETGGELFFALVGEHTDGHRFAGKALESGAAAVVVSKDIEAPAGARLIRVDDPYTALHRLTRALRREVPRRLVGLTGSAGKTTTKEILAAMLARRFRTARSPGNLNNLLGFPIALAGIPEDTEWMVAEMGMSTPEELGAISRLARPDAAMLLNVRPAHLENFGTLEAIAEAKAEILQGLAPDGLLVANADDPQVARVAPRHPGRIVWFGSRPEEEARKALGSVAGAPLEYVRALDIEALSPEASAPPEAPRLRFRVESPFGSGRIETPLHGLYNTGNVLAAAAAALALGVPFAEVAAAAREARPAAGRGELRRAGAVTVIDDSYNSNPDALTRALESAAATAAGGRRWLVAGDMLELGPAGPEFHREAGRIAARLGFGPIVGVGELARQLVEAAGAEGADERRWFASAGEAADWIPDQVAPGDLLLVKGSRGVGLDAVVAALTSRAAERRPSSDHPEHDAEEVA